MSFAQQTGNSTQGVIGDPQTVVVTGSFEPIPLSEANRSVVSLNLLHEPLLYDSLIDALHSDSSIDLEERAPDGVQTDLSIRGATFEQSLVLVNGLRMNDAQSGHHDMDLPLPAEAVSRIEILHGAGSTLYGADAMGGAVNFITTPPVATEVRARVGLGNFGFNQEHAVASFLGSKWSERVAASRDSSSGFRPDRDYQSGAATSETYLKTGLGSTDVLLAGSDRSFGADQFYGDYPSWERTKAWFASVWQALGKDTDVAFGYRRHSDEFVLVRDDPAFYENNHISRSWQADLRHRSSIRKDWKLEYGLETDGDEIDSNNLGHHARNRGAGYVNLDLQALRRVFLTLGAREEVFSGDGAEFLPSFAGGVWLRKGLRLRASASRAFRLPTYTDLYYNDPADIGNPFLKSESAWDFEGGPEWNPGGRISAQLTVFNRREHDDIDYVRNSPNAPWQATNVNYVAFVGVETAVRLRLPKSEEVGLAYTELRANQQVQPGFTSKYVFNYPSHNASFIWTGQCKDLLSFRTRVGATQRVGQGAYAVWDLAVSGSKGEVRPYVQLSNLSNTDYQEIPAVIMPSRTIVGGVEFILRRHP
jgi:outer membrane cobalamin receptor